MRYIILDLETVPVSNAADFISTDDIEAPSNYKNPDAIERYVTAAKAKRLADAALDMDLARICVLSYQRDCDSAPRVYALKSDKEEAAQLEQLRGVLADGASIITFNGRVFDLPLLMRRARYLGVVFPRINLDRYKSFHVDLYEELTMKGSIKSHSLRWYMRRLGWTDLLNADPLKDGGSDVATACAEGRWDDITAHAAVDVKATLRLAQWMGVVPAEMSEATGAVA